MYHNKLKIFEYTKLSTEDALFLVSDIIDNPEHPQFLNAMDDIKSIDLNVLDEFVLNNRVEKFLDDVENIHFEKCRWFLIDTIQKGISAERLKLLTENTPRPAPYNSENLSHLNIGENNLVSIKDFNLYNNGFEYNEFIYALNPVNSGSNSSYWISSVISQLSHTKNLNFKIRLNPFIEIPQAEYLPIVYKMTIYGKPLDWERLKKLREEEFGQWMNDSGLSNNNITDYVWRPENDEVHFTCEELPSLHEVEYNGSRYFHAILDKKTGLIKHCDGAIRVYKKEELENRLKFHVRKSEVRKVGKRIKVFQLDEEIDQETFALLFTNFMVWNHDAINYFNPK